MTRFAFFYQSVISDWNHGNAHFLRGMMRALQARGHPVICYEQTDNWSLTNLLAVTAPAGRASRSDHACGGPDLGRGEEHPAGRRGRPGMGCRRGVSGG